MEDIIIIGAGVTGSLIARELSKYQLSILLIEKENDVGNVTSSANSAIIHSGYDPVPGTLKAKLNVLGCEKYPKLCNELDVEYINCGTLTIMDDPSQESMFNSLFDRAKQNGVKANRLTKEEVLKLEPNITNNVIAGLYCPSAGVVNPFELVVNICENAVDNGVKLHLNEEVLDIINKDTHYEVVTNKSTYETKCVINAAGLYSDKIASLVEKITWNIIPRKGEYYVLDHSVKNLVNRPIFPLPSEKGKGILVGITTSGNYYLGPSSEPQEDKDDDSTDSITLGNIKNGANRLVPNIPIKDIIRVFSGVRATPSTHDFIIEESKTNKGFINVAGIESPGLASSPAIAEYVIDNFISKNFALTKKDNFNPYVRKHIRPKLMSEVALNQLIKTNPDYGKIICQCEMVSLGEIKDSLSRSVPPHSVKGVKRRTRAGFGRCQGGYCMQRVIKILANYYHVDVTDICYDGINSEVIKSKK